LQKEKARMKRTLSAFMLVLLLVSILTLAFKIQPVRAEPRTWTVDDDGPADFHTIQEAINAANSGDTIFVKAGTYYENVIVNKTLSLIGESRDATVIDGNGMGFVVQALSNNVTIRNFTIMNAFTGISADESAYTRIENNWVRSCYQGIRFWSSFGNVIKGNIITSIMLFSDSGAGILLYGSSNNIITENTITLNEWTGIGFDSSNNNSVSGNNITNNGSGILLGVSSNNTISGNSIINNDYGIRLYKSSLSNISRNNITANNVDGIWLSDSSNYNSIAENSVANNGQGISLSYSSNNSVAENNITNNNYGIHLVSGASNNSIFGNTITENLNDGIKIEDSYNNTISENTIKNNFCGIWLYESSNNSIYHNNFVITAYTDPWGRKYQHVYTHSAYPNFWDDGYPSGGNYWSDYEERYPDASEMDGSGIWDTPYLVYENNQDNYPLMHPYGSARAIAATVDIGPDVLNLKGKLKWVNAYLELPEGCNVGDVDVSTLRLNMTIPAELEPTAIGDYDNDTIPDLMVEFNRTAVSNLILSQGIMTGNVTLTITGQLHDGMLFEGSDVIAVRMPGDINSDGKVDAKDIALVSFAFGSYLGHPRWKLIADENEDGKIDVRDVSLIARNFGKTYT
jgi:parallel beta-helix repeat protein